METQMQSKTQPFLTRYAVTRIAQPPIGGGYCAKRHIWVEETPEGSRAIVNTNVAFAGLVTKTHTVQEQDDDHFICVSELVTKAGQEQQVNDQNMILSLREMVTKTYLQAESDDQGPELL